jgi:hypothetical protein
MYPPKADFSFLQALEGEDPGFAIGSSTFIQEILLNHSHVSGQENGQNRFTRPDC